MLAVPAAGLAALACAAAGQAIASDDLTPPPAAFKLPGVTLKIVPSQITVATRDEVTFSATLTRKLERGALELTLPKRWRERASDGKLIVTAPNAGRASTERVRVRRTGRVVRFSLNNARPGDVGRYTVADRGLPSATYEVRWGLRVDGHIAATGTASVVVLALPVETVTP